MAGKVDSATHAAAIAKISEAAKHELELRAHLDEIIKGAAFKGSHRSQDFLKHIVEQALHGEPADLRERSIGVALFGRPVTYDTADDAIVRVTASDVRKRLLQHYGNTGVRSRFRINLPSGSYVPEFCFVPASGLESLDTQVAAIRPAETTVVPHLPTDEVHHRTRGWRRLAAAIVFVCAAAFGWWAVERWIMTSGSTDNLIVAAFQGTPRAAQVVVADDALVLIQVLLDRRFTLQEYENLTYLNVPELAQKKDLLRFWGSLSTRQITNVGDLQNANHIAGDLQARGWDATIRQARQMHARSFRTGNFVVLGSSLSNPWADLFPVNESNFPFDELPRPGKPEVILNRNPLQGEPAKFEVHLDTKTGKKITFARVYLLENTAHSGRVLLVAGQSMSATEMAGELLLRNGSTAQVRQMLGLPSRGRLPDLEMVLRVSEQNEIGDSVELVACRKVTQHTE
ncbi:MAG TPA: hypothetical protein VNY05_28105 [Candidatus Acidoferrales bacterium]|nr:hypothetical protein [Candidatus Acidoferrales bacterium]